MFKLITLLTAAAAPLALAAPAPAKRSTPLSCVEFQYGGPFTSFGFNGFIHLYSNITTYDSVTETTSFNETRLGSSSDGTIEPCGDCRTTELFGFEVCQGPERKGFNGLGNSASEFYGHITYENVSEDIQCLTAQSTPYNGSALVLAPCQYDYDNAASSGQYFSMTIEDGGVFEARLVDEQSTYGPNPSLNNGSSLTLYDGPVTSGYFTYFGFKAQQF